MDRRSTDSRILAMAAAHGMVVTAHQLAAVGVPRHGVRQRVGGLLTPMARGVFAVGPVTAQMRLRAALALVPAGAASHRSAADLWRVEAGSVPFHDVLTPLGRRTARVVDGVRIRSTRWLPAVDVCQVDGIRVTSVARTLCDLATELSKPRLSHLVEQAVVSGIVSALDVQACASAWCRRGRAGSGQIRALNLDLFADEPMAASELERRAMRLFEAEGLSGGQAQYRPPWYDGVRGVVDLAWPELRLVVELDGRRWHATSQAMSEDRRRDRLAASHGWTTLRFGWQEIVMRPGTVVDEWRAVAASRSVPPRADTPD